MNVLEFIAAMTKALAWPLVVLVAIILFRHAIGRLPITLKNRSLGRNCAGRPTQFLHRRFL
jgi:hypothetical protein